MTEKQKKANDQKIYRWGIAVIVFLSSALLLSVCYSSLQKQSNEVLIPDVAPEETEPNIETIQMTPAPKRIVPMVGLFV